MQNALRQWLEELGRHQYRNPSGRFKTYGELLTAFPSEPAYLSEYCRAAYQCGRLEELDNTVRRYLTNTQLTAVVLPWAGHLAWARGEAAQALQYWTEYSREATWPGARAEAEMRQRITRITWKVQRPANIDGNVILYVHPQLAQTLSDQQIQTLLDQLAAARRRFEHVVGQPFTAASRIYLYPDRQAGEETVGRSRFGCANTELGEIHDTPDGELLPELLFTVDGGWPNYHSELYAGLCCWAKADAEALRTSHEHPHRAPVYRALRLPDLLVGWDAGGEYSEQFRWEIASLLEFLIETKGWSVIIDWMREKELIDSFGRHFGLTWSQAETGWRAWRASRARRAWPGEEAERSGICSTELQRTGSEPVGVGPVAAGPIGPDPAARETAAFWEAVRGGRWADAERWLAAPLENTSLSLELGADPEYLYHADLVPQVAARVGDDVVIQHYVLKTRATPETLWGVCRLRWVSTPAGWRIAGLTCYATDPSAWRRRTAAGYAPNRPWPGAEFRRHVLELAAARGLTSPVICELGIGSGRVARSFVEAGDRYIGIDSDQVMIDELISSWGGECPPNLQLVKSDIKQGIPLPDNSVDIIIEVQVFSSFDRDIARERARILRPDGFVLARFSGNAERGVGGGDPRSWQQVYDHDAWIHRKFNVYMTRGREPWPKESAFQKPRPAADAAGEQRPATAPSASALVSASPSVSVADSIPFASAAPNESPPPPPDPDYRWQKENPFASLTYRFSLRQHYRELRLNRLVFMTVGPEPWWSERARLLDAEAERLGITFTDSVLRERWVTGELWEASTLKRWAALAV